MKPYDRLTILRNRYRVRDLRLFRTLVERFYERSEHGTDGFPVDWEGAQAARAEINRMLPRITQVVEAARIGISPAAGGTGVAVGRPDALQHIFTDRYVRSGGQEVVDVIDMTIGVYEASRYDAMGRTLNPMFYVGGFLNFVFGLPRRFFVALGFGRPSRATRAQAEEIKRLEAVASRLGDAEEMIELRLEELREGHGRQLAEQAREITDLAERLDFTERVLAQQREKHPTPPDPAAPSGRR